jgi:hypothetical protein
MRNAEGDPEYTEHPPVRRCGHCGEPLLTQRKRARYCSREHKELAREARKRASDRLTTLRKNHPLGDVSLTELHDQAAPPRDWRDDPRNFSDFGELPDDYEIAAQIDAEDEQDRRINAMLQEKQDRRTPRDIWRKWRSYGKRHGTEDPEQTADRLARHQASEAAKMAKIDSSTAGRIQDRFDPRTAANVANKAAESRKLNARHVEQPPPLFSQEFSFEAEQATWDGYRRGPGGGHRPKYADYQWRMDDGFVHNGF